MSENIILIIAGVVICLVGLSKQSGLKLSNFGFNFWSTSKQTIVVGNVAPEAAPGKKHDWIGLAIAGFGFLTALAGLFKKG